MSDAAIVEAQAPGRTRRVGFRIVVGLAVALMVATWAAVWPPDLTHPVTGWLPDASFEDYLANFADEEMIRESGGLALHRHHFMAGSLILWTFLIGIVVQLRKPETKQAPLWLVASMVLIVFLLESTLVSFDPFTLLFVVLIGAALALHPRRWPAEGISLMGQGRGVAFAAAAAAVAYGAGEAFFQVGGGATDIHGLDGHYAFMAAAALTLAVAAVLGASNLTGARLVAWMAGVMGTLVGAFFVGFPGHASSPGVVWGAIGVGLGIAYLLAVARPRMNEVGR